ncbi:1-acyl-sn-glycerol-3-phosphate acyltransferase [Candidatus Rhabdochlamydia oedothoracis]|uniref:1-acyl-sn-glycerol-3-phosphate acyltransferase n=1 Tax=Candidatus Rhabdochlamydia oedothoracis TaxID=2720720 RepID=UPI001C651689|nr:1-acyl-sn-glycerol-3-phosphate acyltransferase [Candidatus Rhabdochlamydia oedothoracis]
MHGFYTEYKAAALQTREKTEQIFLTFLELVLLQCADPFSFSHYHQRLRRYFDYHKFALDFVRPLIDISSSSLKGELYLEEIDSHLKNKDNVILFANHQSEGDPQMINILLEKKLPKIAEELIFVAGDRVISDPLAVPLSLGCNLLCIYSKRYIDNPPELKMKKQLHNKKTMDTMSCLLKKGGNIIYVAPSGGRDRSNSKGVIEVADFDPPSIEMFYLIAKRSLHPTHFYPLALKTYAILPPPKTIQVELGESRTVSYGPIQIAFGPEINMENRALQTSHDKHARRKERAEFIYNLVRKMYNNFS